MHSSVVLVLLSQIFETNAMLESVAGLKDLSCYVSDSQETTMMDNAEIPEVFIQLQIQMTSDIRVERDIKVCCG